MKRLLRDLGSAWRTLRRQRGYAAVVVATLALGIGPTTAIWSVLDAFVMRPLPFPDSDRLVSLEKLRWREGRWSRYSTVVSIPLFRDLYERNRSFEQMACFMMDSFNLGGDGEPERVRGAQVSDRFFDVLGVQPVHGRFFVPGEDQGNVPRVVVLSHALFQRRFGGDPSAVGRTIEIDREPHRVIGVLPDGLEMPERVDLWVPLHTRILRWSRFNNNMTVLARLAPDIGRASAEGQLNAAARELLARYPETEYRFATTPMKSIFFPEVRQLAWVLMATVLMALAVAGANVAHLAAAQAVGRQQEMAIRAAFGAGRPQLIRQLLTENVVLACAGGVLGLVIAVVAMRVINTSLPPDVPTYLRAALDVRVFLFSLAVSVVTGLIVGVLPSRIATRPTLMPLLKEGGTEGGGLAPRRQQWSRPFVFLEAALTLVLLIAAVSLVREVGRLRHVDPGFESENVLAMGISLSAPRYPSPSQIVLFYRELLERLRTIPGVENAAAASEPPIGEESHTNVRLSPEEDEGTPAVYTLVTPGYFRTLGIPLVRGQVFTDQHRFGGDDVVIVNESWVRRFAGGKDPLGWRVGVGIRMRWTTVIGVVGDVRQSGLDRPAPPHIYLVHEQYPLTSSEIHLFLESGEREGSDLATAARLEVEGLDPGQPVYDVTQLGSVVELWLLRYRIAAWLAGLLAALAAVQALVGVAGVVSYAVQRERRAMAVKMAVGATRQRVLREVVQRTMGWVVAALAVGLGLSLALLRWMASLIDGLGPSDPVLIGGAFVLSGLAAWAASYLPARRITELEPMEVLRGE